MRRLCAILLLVAGLLAVGAAASSSPNPPSRLWYKATLEIVGTYTADLGTHIKRYSSWGLATRHAVIVKVICIRRSTGERLASEPCAQAFSGRRRPAGAVNDVAFVAGAGGLWEIYDDKAVSPAFHGTNREGPYHCTERVQKQVLIQPVSYTDGSMGSSSLVHDGISFTLEYPAARPGRIRQTDTGYTCTYEDTGRVVTYPPTSRTVPEISTPWTSDSYGVSSFAVAKLLRVPSIGGRFGDSFSVTRTVTKSSSQTTGKIKATLQLNVCPGGGRSAVNC